LRRQGYVLKPGLLWPRNLVAQVPGEKIGIVGVLETSTGREQQVVVFIEVVDGADVEPRALVSINRFGGLMEYFPSYREFVRDLPLE
jgi:hypothetical protein